MKNLYLILIAVFISSMASFAVKANEVNIDPTVQGQTTLTVTCEYPIEREDGTPLALNEIAKVNFFVVKDGLRTAAGSNDTECKQVYDMAVVPDGVYLYVVQTEDTGGRTSSDSDDFVIATVKRLPNPRSPTAVSGSVS